MIARHNDGLALLISGYWRDLGVIKILNERLEQQKLTYIRKWGQESKTGDKKFKWSDNDE